MRITVNALLHGEPFPQERLRFVKLTRPPQEPAEPHDGTDDAFVLGGEERAVLRERLTEQALGFGAVALRLLQKGEMSQGFADLFVGLGEEGAAGRKRLAVQGLRTGEVTHILLAHRQREGARRRLFVPVTVQ